MAKRIIFNEETIDAIKHFAEVEQHTVTETCNKFNISMDIMRRLIFQYNIHPLETRYSKAWEAITDDKVKEVVNLFTCTDMPLNTLYKTVGLDHYATQYILKQHFTEEEIKARKSRVYKKSKLADKNPMYGKRGAETSNWRGGIVSDGQGYLITKKPDWYTGRARSDYVFYHSVVMCEALGITEIPKGFAVHHIDHNPLNNNINNLALVSMGAHSRLHQIEKKMMLQGSETIRNGVDADGVQTPDLDRPE